MGKQKVKLDEVISSKTKNRMIRNYERSYRNKVLANEKMFEYEREKSKTKESRKTSLKNLKIESSAQVIITSFWPKSTNLRAKNA